MQWVFILYLWSRVRCWTQLDNIIMILLILLFCSNQVFTDGLCPRRPLHPIWIGPRRTVHWHNSFLWRCSVLAFHFGPPNSAVLFCPRGSVKNLWSNDMELWWPMTWCLHVDWTSWTNRKWVIFGVLGWNWVVEENISDHNQFFPCSANQFAWIDF